MDRITAGSTLITLGAICLFILVAGDDDCDSCYEPDAMAIKFFACGLVIIIGSLWFTRKYKVIENIIFDIESHPILETNEATAEIAFSGKGIVESDNLITSQLAKEPCVYYHSIIEELIGSGKEKHWEVIKNEVKHIPFYIKDERGRLRVDLTNVDSDLSDRDMPKNVIIIPNHPNSEVDAEAVFNKKLLSDIEKTNNQIIIFNKNRAYRKSEFILRPATKVFVFGYVISQNNELTLVENKHHPLIVSRKTQQEYVDQFYKGKNLVFYVHIFVFAGYLISLFSLEHFITLPSQIWTMLYFVIPTLIVGSVIFSIFNRIITLEQRMHNSLSNIDTELNRRYNLIPNLISVVKAFSVHEEETQTLIASLRSKAIFSNKNSAEKINPALNELKLLEESYPDLKASENYRSLMISLIDTEERLAYSRSFYNRSARKYNILVKQFPFNIIASLFNKTPKLFINLG